MQNKEKTFPSAMSDVPALPSFIFAGVEAGIRRNRRNRIILAIAAVCAFAIALPFTIAERKPSAPVLVSELISAQADSIDTIDAILDDAGSLFHEDVSSDQEFLAIAMDSYDSK